MDTINFWQFGLSFLVVIGLMLGMAWIAKKMHFGKSVLPSGTLSGNGRKLRLLEMLPIDRQRRIIRFQSYDTEFLLLLGPQGDTVLSQLALNHETSDH